MANDAELLDAVVRVIVRDGWDNTALHGIAAEAGVSLAELYDRIPHRCALAGWIVSEIDRATLRSVGTIDLGQSPRDRLFEILMARFDQLQRLKPALSGRRSRSPQTAVDLAASLLHFPRSLGWMLEAAGLADGGLRGVVRAQALGYVYVSTIRHWLSDDSADLAKTMKALDQALARVARWIEIIPPTADRNTAGSAV